MKNNFKQFPAATKLTVVSSLAIGFLLLHGAAPVFGAGGETIQRRVSSSPAAKPAALNRDQKQHEAAGILSKFAFIESSNRPNCIGDGGAARGLYQMHLPAVIDCGGTRADWLNLTNAATAHKFAGLYLNRIAKQLARENIPQSPANLYLCWNLGIGGARRINFDVSKAPKTTQKAIAKL